MPLPSSFQLRHLHDVNHKTGPAGEMLCALTVAGLRIVLLPSKPCPLPFVEDVVDEITTQSGVESCSSGLVRGGRPNGNVLRKRRGLVKLS